MNPESWVASYALSRVIESKEVSLSHLETVLDKLVRDTEWQNERGHKGILARVIYSLGDKYWEDGERQEEAIATYSKVFGLGRSIHLFSSFSDVLQKYSMAGCWEPMITFFERLLDEPQDGPNAAGEFLMDRLLEPGEAFLSLLVKLFETSARYDLLETLFVRAIARPLPGVTKTISSQSDTTTARLSLVSRTTKKLVLLYGSSIRARLRLSFTSGLLTSSIPIWCPHG